MNQEKIYRIVSISYFILSIYAIICFIFGTDSNRNPMTFRAFVLSLSSNSSNSMIQKFYFGFWGIASIFILIVFLLSIVRFVKLLKKKDDSRLYLLKKLEKNVLSVVVLAISFSFFVSAYTKELSFMILILIVLLFGVYFTGYFLEGLYITKNPYIEFKKIIMNAIVTFVILIVSILLLVLSSQFNIGCVSGIEELGNGNLQKQLPSSWHIWRFINFLIYTILCLKLFQHLSIQDMDHIKFADYYTIVTIALSFLIILIQNVIKLNSDYSIQFLPYFLENHLGSIILLVALVITIGLLEGIYDMNIQSPKMKRKKDKQTKENPQAAEEDQFSGFKF